MSDVYVLSSTGTLPVSVEDIKKHSRITGEEDNQYINLLIEAATSHVEGYLKRSITPKNYSYKCRLNSVNIELPRPPLISVNSIKYKKTTGAYEELNNKLYEVDAQLGVITFTGGQTLPTIGGEDNVIIAFTSGYENVEDIPTDIRLAIMWLVDHWYEHRSSVSELKLTKTPIHFSRILWGHRVNIL